MNAAVFAAEPGFAIAVHGGAGLDPGRLSDAERLLHDEALRSALAVGQAILSRDGSALDAVEQTVRALEDNPLYNAGRGAVLNHERTHELDASIMDGSSRQGGAVAGVKTVKNPISLARLVMSETRHVLLSGQGAERFADEMRGRPQIERVPNEYFGTDKARQELERALQREKLREGTKEYKGTVGCVALDRKGNLAAGTSTGGLTNKKWGRVGDSPILGAGTYADNSSCAVSCTGTGEFFILNSVAFHMSALMKYRQWNVEESATEIVDRILPNDTGGLIAIDSAGRIVTRCNTPGMPRGWIERDGSVHIRLER